MTNALRNLALVVCAFASTAAAQFFYEVRVFPIEQGGLVSFTYSPCWDVQLAANGRLTFYWYDYVTAQVVFVEYLKEDHYPGWCEITEWLP